MLTDFGARLTLDANDWVSKWNTALSTATSSVSGIQQQTTKLASSVTQSLNGASSAAVKFGQDVQAAIAKFNTAMGSANVKPFTSAQDAAFKEVLATLDKMLDAQDEVARSAGRLGDVYQRNATAFTDSANAAQRTATAYAEGARAYERNLQAFQSANTGINASITAVRRGVDQITEGFVQMGRGSKEVLDSLGSSLVKASLGLGAIGAALTGPFVLGVHAAAEFEQSMVGVRRTLGAFEGVGDDVEENFQGIAKGLRDISSVSGMATGELAGIAEQAARLGLKSKDDVLAFTDAVQKVSQVTGIAGPAVARDMASLAKAMDFPIDQMERLGSAVVEVGRITQSSDREILGLAQILTGTARTAGLSTEQLLTLSAAISSTGGASFMAGQAFNILLTRMTQAVQEGDDLLDIFAKVTHLVDSQITSAEAFAELFRSNPMRAITEFFQGLNASGEKGVIVLQRLGLEGGRTARAFLQFAQQAASIPAIQERVNKAISDGTALQTQYNNVQATFEEILKDVERAAQAALVETYQDALVVLKPVANALLDVINTAREFPVVNKLAAAVATLTGGFALLGSTLGFTAKGLLETTANLGTIISGFRDAKALAGIETIGQGFAKIAGGAKAAIAGIVNLGLALAAFATTPGGLILLAVGAIVGGLVLLDQQTGIVTKTVSTAADTTEDWARRSVRAMEDELRPAATATGEALDGFFRGLYDWLQIDAIDAWVKRQLPWLQQFADWLSKTFPGQVKEGAEKTHDVWIDNMQGMADAVAKEQPLFESVITTIKKSGEDLDVEGKKTMARRAAEAKKLLEDLQTFQIRTNAQLDLALTTGTLSEQEVLVKRMAMLDKAESTQRAAFALNLANAKQTGKEAVAAVTSAFNQQMAQTEASRQQLIGQSEKSFQASLDAELKAQADLTDELAKLYNSDYQNSVRAQDAKLRDQEQAALKSARLTGAARTQLEAAFRLSPDAGEQLDMFEQTLKNLRALGQVSDEDYEKFAKFITQQRTLHDVLVAQSDVVDKLRVDWEKARATTGDFTDEQDRQNAAFAIGRRRYEDLSDAEKALADLRAMSIKQQRQYSVETDLLTKDVDQAAVAFQAEAAALGLWGSEAQKAILVAQRSHGRLTLGDLTPEARQALDRMFDEQAQTKLLQGIRENGDALNVEAAAFGQVAMAADVARQAQLLYGKNVGDLTTAQRTLIETQQALIVATQALKQASDLYYALGIPKYEGAIIALQAMEIQSDQAKLQSALSTLQTINDSRQKSDQLHAQLLAAEGQREGDFWKFLTGQVQNYAAQQDTIWQGIGKMIVDTFGNVQRSLSDVFFNVFTGQAQSLKDVFKNLLNSILRSLADFLASATVKAFLSFLGNLMQGQGAGEAAGNALGSLFASPTAGGSTGSLTQSTGIMNTLASGTGWIGSALRGLGITPANAATSVSGGSSGGYALTAPGSMTLNSQGVYPTSFSTPVVTSGNSSLFGGDVSGLSSLADYVGTSGSFFDYSSTFGAFTGTEYATGGWVPGAGRGDIVPAMLEPGEFVVRRSVAEQMGPALDVLNGGGRGRAQNGRLYFATGGTVDLSGLSGLTTSDLQTLAVLQAIYMVQQQQLATQQQIGSNTGQTAVALTGSQAPAPTAGATQIIGTGGGVQPVTVGGSGMASSAAAGGGGGGTGSGSGGPSSLQQILPLLQSAAGLGGSAAKLGNLFFNPGGAGGTTFTKNLNATLGLIGGGLNLTGGIASGNITQSIGGGISFLGGIAGLTPVQNYLNELAPNLIGSLGLGSVASGALSIAGGGLGLYTGITDMINNGVSAQNVISTVLAGAGVYSGIAGLAGLPTISAGLSALGGALSGTALGTALGIGAGVAAPVAGGAAGLGAGVAAGAATSAAAGSGAAFGTLGVGVTAGIVMAPLLIGMIVDMVTSIQEKNRADARIFRAKQDLRTVIPQIIDQVPKVANEAWSIVNDPNASIGDLKAIYDKVHSTIDLYNTYDNYFKTGTGAYGMVKVPQLVEIDKQLQPYLQGLQLEIIRGADRLTVMGAPPSAADPLLQPMTLGLAVGLPLTSSDPFIAGLEGAAGGFLPPNMGLSMIGGHLVPTDLYNQTAAVLQPGHLEQGLAALASLYGTSAPDAWKRVGFGSAGGAPVTGLTKMDTSRLTSLAALLTPSNQDYARDIAATSGAPNSSVLSTTFYGSAANALSQGYGFDANAAAQFAEMTLAAAQQAFTSGGMQEGGWVPGLSMGRDSVPMMLEPGEFVIPRPQARKYGPMLASMLGHGQAATAAPVATAVHNAIHITVNGNVDDPQELARVLAPKLRDELRRIEPRYSRAGNKTQV